MDSYRIVSRRKNCLFLFTFTLASFFSQATGRLLKFDIPQFTNSFFSQLAVSGLTALHNEATFEIKNENQGIWICGKGMLQMHLTKSLDKGRRKCIGQGQGRMGQGHVASAWYKGIGKGHWKGHWKGHRTRTWGHGT